MNAMERAVLIAVCRDGFRSETELHDLVSEVIGDMQHSRLLEWGDDGFLQLTDEGVTAYEIVNRDED